MIIIGSDHGGFRLKQEIKKYLENKQIGYKDVGCDSDESVDFPVYANEIAKAVLQEPNGLAIALCGSGIGISMALNRFKGIRAVLISAGEQSAELTRLARQHNDANVLCLGGRFMDISEAEKIVNTFLGTAHLYGKYKARMEMLDKVE